MECIFEFFFNVFYLFLGQRESMNGGGAERGRHRIGNRLQDLSHQPRAWCGARTHRPRDRDLAEVGRLTDCATQAPLGMHFWHDDERDFRHCCSQGWNDISVILVLFLHLSSAFHVLLSVSCMLSSWRWKYRWLSWLSIWLQLRSWSDSSWVWALCQALCRQLRAWSLLGFCLPVLCLSPACTLSLKNK